MKDTVEKETFYEKTSCPAAYLPIRDTRDLVGGKWKLPITHALAKKPLRFKELQREIECVTARTLSKELTVEYSLTEYGSSLEPVVAALHKWGAQHREIFKGTRE